MYFVAMAYDVGAIGQSDYIYLIRTGEGKVFGYSGEFETCTFDIEDACSSDRYHAATWFAPPYEDPVWVPATREELRLLELDKYIVGYKTDMKASSPMGPIKRVPSPPEDNPAK